MKRLIWVSSLLLIFLSACATTPPIPKYQIGQGARVGIFVSITPALFHKHVGFSVFHSFEKTYDINPGLQDYAKKGLSSALTRDGRFTIVDLKALEFSGLDLKDLVIAQNDKWLVPPKQKAIYAKLKDELGLKAVVVIREARTFVFSQCGGYCFYYYLKGHGLVTDFDLLSDNYYAVAAYNTDVFVLNPPANLALGERFEKMRKGKSMRMRGVPVSPDLKNISAPTWEFTKKTIKEYLDRLMDQTAKLLSAG